MLQSIGKLVITLWFIGGLFVALSAALNLAPLISAVFAEPDQRSAMTRLLWSKYIRNVETFGTGMYDLLLGQLFNRTTLIGFTIFIGAQALAAADPSKTSECAAVIAMSLLWVTCDSILRGLSVGASIFSEANEVPWYRKYAARVIDLVRTYAAILVRVSARLKAA